VLLTAQGFPPDSYKNHIETARELQTGVQVGEWANMKGTGFSVCVRTPRGT